MHEVMGINNDAWIEEPFEEDYGILSAAVALYREEVENLSTE